MKKKDLKTGMRVMTKNGGVFIVLKDVDLNLYGHQELIFINDNEELLMGSFYNDDLTRKDNDSFSIVKVYDSPANTLLIKKEYRGTLLWEKDESPFIKEMRKVFKEADDKYKREPESIYYLGYRDMAGEIVEALEEGRM